MFGRRVMKQKNTGFTLIEVLISLLIFAFGMLGVTLQMSKSMSNTISNEVHSSVMQLAMQSIEPLNTAVLKNQDTFNDALNNLVNFGNTPAFATNNSQLKTFNIRVDRALDSNNNSLMTTASSNWSPPYTIILKVDYVGKENTTLSFFTTHVLVPGENPS